MLWACVYLPRLPLLVMEQRLAEPVPLVIEVTRRQRRLVAFANELALAAGMRPGMTIATALSLDDEVSVQCSHPDYEAQALQQLAVALYRFSPYIQYQCTDSLVVELSGSLRLFHGAECLADRMRECVAGLFDHFKLALCTNPDAALLLARSASTTPNCALSYSLAQLDSCAVDNLEITAAQRESLAGMGIERVGDLLALPRDAVGRRFGQAVVGYLNRLQELEPCPRHCFQLPESFAQRIEFVQEVERTGQLLFPLRRLLGYLEQYLQVRQQAVTAMRVTLELRDQRSQSLPLQLASADYRSSHIMPLLQLKLERQQLSAPVRAVSVTAGQFVMLSARQADLLGDDAPQREDCGHLLDRLRARLGEQQVTGIAAAADHRPELSWQAVSPQLPVAHSPIASDQGARQLAMPGGQALGLGGSALRPCWLLPEPLPLQGDADGPVYGAPLQLLGTPERIETGWWDEHSVNRDYYPAQHGSGQRYWVYFDRQLQCWFLHGVFS